MWQPQNLVQPLSKPQKKCLKCRSASFLRRKHAASLLVVVPNGSRLQLDADSNKSGFQHTCMHSYWSVRQLTAVRLSLGEPLFISNIRDVRRGNHGEYLICITASTTRFGTWLTLSAPTCNASLKFRGSKSTLKGRRSHINCDSINRSWVYGPAKTRLAEHSSTV